MTNYKSNDLRCPATDLPCPDQWTDEGARELYELIQRQHATVGASPVSLFTRLKIPVALSENERKAFGKSHDDDRDGWVWEFPLPGDTAEAYLRRELDKIETWGRVPA